MIRDWLVCGVNDAAIQKRLLAEPALTYEKAVELALSAETAAQSVRELRSRLEQEAPVRAPPQVVYKTGASSSSPASPTPGKFVPTCLIVAVVRDILSRRAGLTITSVSQEGTPPASMQVRTGQSKSKPVGRMGESEESDKDDEQGLQALYHLRTRVAATTPPITVQVKLDMEVDTGASLSLMSESTYKRIWPGRMLEPSHVQLQTYLLSQWWVVLV